MALVVGGLLGGLLAAALTFPAAATAAANVMPQVSGAALTRLQGQRDTLFKQMLADPGNVELTLQYANLSAAAGDLEGAISALERLAIFAPELGRIKFELGVLYLRLAAYDIAKADFQAADAAADATPEMKASIAGYLASIDRQAAGDRLTGALMVGAR